MRLSLDTPSDQVILRALREGRTRQAANSLVLIYSGAVYRACRLSSIDAEVAEEIAYQTYSDLFSDLGLLRGSDGIKTLLLGAARRGAAEALLPELELGSCDPLSLQGEGVFPGREALRKAVEQLAPRHRALLGVAFGFGLPTFPFAAASARDEVLSALDGLIASIGQGDEPSRPEVVLRLGELYWRAPERLQRRLDVLCSSFGGV